MGFDRLIGKIKELGNPTVMGLDPKLSYIPEFIKKSYDDPVLEFNKRLIDAAEGLVPAVKPQSAYYEMMGPGGAATLFETIRYAQKKGMFVILDGKRNDIGETSKAYAESYLGNSEHTYGADALTVNGYLGSDGLIPFIDAAKAFDKGIFILVKTSNKSSGELQDLICGGKPIYKIMGDMCETLGADNIGQYGYSAVGAVVGATYPEQLAELRAKLPHTFFLVPGYGAQGGGAAGLRGGFDKDGGGVIVNSSRAIMTAWQKENCEERDFAEAARREIVRMREDLK
ncbi:MAG: orotidine-5'-phosphate decarboxylase [Ruminococcus sp.]|jgi:orotidine-5'-phosphate decarboxylase|nr:orotidine-5'-phosphate decarboxylase [Ruminococcus sp.]